ncbi:MULTISPECIES: hypothetical protein [Curtobacterium]|uniref:hypothetical protein n=1 Tax=Curtobacterium TaxID=2034 RepID=UPI00349FA26D|nr:hypothetical protein [Curtobacterium flaccumfaciens pv. basellae]
MRQSDAGRSGAKVSIEAGDDDLELSWLASIALPRGTRVEYAAFGSRGNFVVARNEAVVSAVCDFDSGEYVVTQMSSGTAMVSAIALGLVARRLTHLRNEPPEHRRQHEGNLKPLAGLTSGEWFPFETLPANWRL